MLPKLNGDRAPDPGATGRFTRAAGAARDWAGTRGSALRRRIILFNLVALTSLVLGVLYLGDSQDAVVRHRADTLLQSATLMSEVVAAQLPDDISAGALPDTGPHAARAAGILRHLKPRAGTELWLFDPTGRLLARRTGEPATAPPRSGLSETPIMNGLGQVGEWLMAPVQARTEPATSRDPEQLARDLVARAVAEGAHLGRSPDSGVLAAAPVGPEAAPLAVLVLSEAPDMLDGLIRVEQERVLRIFLIAALISVGLSLTLARAISAPLADLALAAETARDSTPELRGADAGRVRIPDLTARPDEIGRLSDSLRGMVAALYQRIESNEQFAADVAHEIKNPLTSLRCAVDTMRVTTRVDQRERLLEVIEHDVRRLDRLVSDISSASRLDSDLVKEEQARFDLLEMLRNLGQHLELQAARKEVAFITDFPDQPIVITGLEARLAQVFVNLIANAISFCGPGDAIRLWARRRGERVLVVVEDTGPGIPADSLEKVFERFYSNRPEDEFGNHSGLGLAISKQIVEAHDGVIWAENIHPTEADATSDPLGVRFVVGLSV